MGLSGGIGTSIGSKAVRVSQHRVAMVKNEVDEEHMEMGRGIVTSQGLEGMRASTQYRLLVWSYRLPVPTNGSSTKSPFCTSAWFAMYKESWGSMLVFPMNFLVFSDSLVMTSLCPSAISSHNITP